MADDAAALEGLLNVGVLKLIDHDFRDGSRRQGTYQFVFKSASGFNNEMIMRVLVNSLRWQNTYHCLFLILAL